MDQIVVQAKHAEMQANGELLVFYVDENGSHQEGVVTAIEHIDESSLQQLQHGNYVIEEISDPTIDDNVAQPVVSELPSNTGTCRWMDDETRKLLIFYVDNKETFLNGSTKKKELWSVACKTMLTGKSPTSCEMKLRNLKRSYSQLCIEYSTGQNLAIWPFYDLCHQAFHDDAYVKMLIKEATKHGRSITSKASLTTAVNNPVIAMQEVPKSDSENIDEKVDLMLNMYLQSNKSLITTQASHTTNVNYSVMDTQETPGTKTADENVDQMVNMYLQSNKPSITTQASLTAVNYPATAKQDVPSTKTSDEKVDQMLNIYLKSKKTKSDLKHVWDVVTAQLGEDADYWYKRFLNYKQHYIRILDKLKESGPNDITWPYMNIFDEIYANDSDFHKKYGVSATFDAKIMNDVAGHPNDDWDDTEKTVLVKYCFDCFDEFQDATIPNTFLWNEIGKLLDKKGDVCKKKYEQLKVAHLDQYISEQYDLNNRVPIAILFDNIIYKETEMQIPKTKSTNQLERWETEEIDSLVQFVYNNLEMFKDQMCHFVCWAALSRKLKRKIQNCLYQWEDLTALYKSIMDDKKEDSDMEVDWRYIDVFDRIFDYGMDTKLLDGYVKPDTHTTEKKALGKTKAKKSAAGSDEDYVIDEEDDDGDYVEERGGVGIQFRGVGDSRQFAILEYHLKNKDKFSKQRKSSVWAAFAKQQGLTADQCAHRFRNLKQVYMANIQREINKPEMPILWPYYSLCKKVFGYRQLKSKLKKNKADNSIDSQWTAKEIKQLISFLKQHFSAIDAKPQDKALWGPLALQIDKTQVSCRDKYLELKKAYTKIKTMRRRNPNCTVNWRYFRLFEEVYTGTTVEEMDVDSDDDIVLVSDVQQSDAEQKQDQEDDDYQCIIIMPENGALENAKVIIKDETKTKVKPSKRTNSMSWSYSSKKLLLSTYLKYVKKHEGKIINTSAMWKEIAEKFPKTKRTPWSCNIMYAKLKSFHKKNINAVEYKDTPFCSLFKKIFAVKLKFYRQPEAVEDIDLTEKDTYEDVDVPAWRITDALKYYHKHLTEFISPRYESGYVWKELSNQVGVPVRKLFRKINYLKQLFKNESIENEGVNARFHNLTKKILEKEVLIRKGIASEPTPTTHDEVSDVTWSDNETERLLQWYLDNLAKFKNPKFVPSYLWMDAGNLLEKTALSCSKKMSEIRTEYSSMVKETPEALSSWNFYELCQKIYGTGKKNTQVSSEAIEVSNVQI